jgi:hypothetical protein
MRFLLTLNGLIILSCGNHIVSMHYFSFPLFTCLLSGLIPKFRSLIDVHKKTDIFEICIFDRLNNKIKNLFKKYVSGILN